MEGGRQQRPLPFPRCQQQRLSTPPLALPAAAAWRYELVDATVPAGVMLNALSVPLPSRFLTFNGRRALAGLLVPGAVGAAAYWWHW